MRSVVAGVMNVRKGPLCIVDWNENDHPINRLSAAELKSFQHAERSRPCALRRQPFFFMMTRIRIEPSE